MPEAVLVEIAAALAAKAAGSLYDFVKDRFKGREKALAALEAADGAAPESSQVIALANELQAAGDYDPGFAELLRAQWAATQSGVTAADAGKVINSVSDTFHSSVNVSGDIHGSVIHAHNIQGNITLG